MHQRIVMLAAILAAGIAVALPGAADIAAPAFQTGKADILKVELPADATVRVDGTIPGEVPLDAITPPPVAEIDGFVTIGDSAIGTTNSWPWNSSNASCRFQMMYLPTEMTRGGIINQFGFQVAGTSLKYAQSVCIKLCNTTVSAVGTDLNANYGTATPETVYFRALDTIGTGVIGTYDMFVFDRPFSYNGTGNLLVEITYNIGTSNGPSCRQSTVSPNRRTWVWQWNGNTGVMADAARYNARFSFLDTISNDVGITNVWVSQPYTTVQGQAQTITATIYNTGVNTQTSIPLFYNAGGSNVSETWTGSLAQGASVNYTFTAPWTPTTSGGQEVICATTLGTDTYHANDTLRRTLPVFVTGTKVGQLFNATQFAPPGWQANIISGSYNWQRSSGGTYPTCAPLEGAGMATYQSWYASTGHSARLVAHPFSVGSTAENIYCRLFMYGDPGYSTSNDRVIVEYSTDSMATWNVVDSFSRYNAVAGWYQKNAELGTLAANARVFVGFRAVSAYGNNMYVDSIRIRYEVPVPNDIALDAILEPARFYSNTDVTPVIRIKNRGTASQSAIPVYVTADSAGTVIYSANATYAGPLAAGDTASVA
ncbi:MAG: CARDB domain-containing protein, partial [bacterium]